MSSIKSMTTMTWIVNSNIEHSPNSLPLSWSVSEKETKTQLPITKMTHLKQGSMTINELIVKFEELEYLTNYNNTAHIQDFKQICDPQIIDLLVNKIPAPVLLSEWKDQAATLDRQRCH